MNIAVLGTGMVGRALAGKLAETGHAVVMGTRDPAVSLANSASDRMGNPPLSAWLSAHPGVSLADFAGAAAQGELVINAARGAASLEVLAAAGAANLAGKILVDISNPLDFSRGMPPSLFVSNTDSLAEQIQRAHPQIRVVKALNTLTAALMVNPESLAGGDHSVFICGDDEAAKLTVTNLLRSFGWRDIFDLGDLRNARGLEMALPVWISLMGVLQTPMFNFKIVRQ